MHQLGVLLCAEPLCKTARTRNVAHTRHAADEMHTCAEPQLPCRSIFRPRAGSERMRITRAIIVLSAIASAAGERLSKRNLGDNHHGHHGLACGGTRQVRNLGDNHAPSHPCPTSPPLLQATTTTPAPDQSPPSTAMEGVASAGFDHGAGVASETPPPHHHATTPPPHLGDAELGVGGIPESNLTSSFNASHSNKNGGRAVMQSSSVTAMAEKTTAVVGTVVAISACASIAGSGAGPMPLIFQLQLLSQFGKIGGGSGALATFSESFGYARARSAIWR